MNGKKSGDDNVSNTGFVNLMNQPWDPTKMTSLLRIGSNTRANVAAYRVKKDLLSLFNDPPPGLFAIPDETDLMLIHAVIIGPMETPYEGGFFYFVIRCTERYPIEPPLVKLMTTDSGRVRFNPNLYRNGKVCLSILGTWTGPAWSPAQQISSVLISIQSLMNEKPYYNEPGMRSERFPGEASHYNDIIAHETLRVAVCGMLENECHLAIPTALQEMMEENFLSFYEQYVTTAESKKRLDGETMNDPFADMPKSFKVFQFKNILVRLKNIHAKVSEKIKTKKDKEEEAGSSSDITTSKSSIDSKKESIDDDDFLYDDD